MTAPAASDRDPADEALADVYRLLITIGRRRPESKNDDTNDKQPADEQAA